MSQYKVVERQIEVFTKDLFWCAVTEHRFLFYIFILRYVHAYIRAFEICTHNLYFRLCCLLECVLINEKCYQASIIDSLCICTYIHSGNDVDDDNFFVYFSCMCAVGYICTFISLTTFIFNFYITQEGIKVLLRIPMY